MKNEANTNRGNETMKRFLLDLTATNYAADYFYVEVFADHVDGYILLGDARLPYEDVVNFDRYTLFAARHSWKSFASSPSAEQIDPDDEAFQAALEAGDCHDGNCEHYVCTEGRILDEWDEPEPTDWDYRSEAFAATVEVR